LAAGHFSKHSYRSKQEIQTAEATYAFQIDPTWKEKLANGLDDISITQYVQEQVVN
jgi:3-isopropylmalate/(R)-2-methylmalate dehydratase small subunit